MRQLTVLLVFTFLTLFATNAQAQKITGNLSDTSEKKSVHQAVVLLMSTPDSMLYKFTRTNKDGKFEFNAIKPGKYILQITHPFYGDYVDDINVAEGTLNLNTISYTPKAKLLQEIIIKSGSPIRIKGDTVTYTADSFKVSANANVEELLKKLPGIQVDKNGKIKAMGENVEKVLVDGEEFFGDDPGMAVKNLRADAVKEVQVFDKKSEQAEFTGIDDGKSKKTINLKLKEDRKKGFFGKVETAGGLMDKIDNRYNNNIMINAFKGKRKFAGYLLQGNTGQNGLNWQEQQKYGGSDDNVTMSMDEDGGGMMWMSRGNDEDPYVDTRNGFFENLNAGLQYSNKWGEKQNLNFSPKFNRQQYNNTRNSFMQLQLGDSLFNTTSDESSAVYKSNVKNNLVYDLKIDSLNSLKVTTKLNFYDTRSNTISNSENLSKTGIRNNDAVNSNSTENNRTNFSTSVLFKHKFKKDRRTLSVNADISLANSKTLGDLNAINNYYASGILNRTDSIDQKKDNKSLNQKGALRAVYTEPLSKKYSLELNYEFSLLGGDNNQATLSKSNSTLNKYDQLVDSLSNHFKQNIITNRAGFKVSFKNKKVKYGVGAGAGFTQFKLDDITYGIPYKRNFTNLFPAANFQYTYKANHSLSVDYNGQTIQPTINQLQQLRNNNNPLSEYIGNPLLEQSFRHGFNVNHNSYNFLKEIWTYQGVNINFTNNAITNSVIIEPNGKTITKPINTDGNMQIGSWMGSGMKIKKLKLDFNINLNFNYSQSDEFVNNIKNTSKNLGASIYMTLGRGVAKKFDIYLSNEFGYNVNKTTIYGKPIRYNTNTTSLNASVYIKKTWKLGTDVDVNYRQQTAQFAGNVNNTLWNAMLEKTFRKDEFTLFVTVKDILNQNIGVDRNFNGNTLSEVRNDRLKRFCLVGFRWDFKNKGSKAK
ncbi:MAG: outer membrane beta-barrel protein [Ferruginibacter sp.]